MSDTQISGEKIWEKPWNSQEIVNNSTNWSLAGDAGLLLQLKSFAENFMSKAANIEKDLQKLSFEEQQCRVKFENVTSNFLQLENFQFIENRVYEQDLTSLNQNLDSEKPEKSKEEKEQELFEIINESVGIGMSIMDNYFDKIDGTKSDYESDEENEDKNDDLIIYETKDPYVLRSLPYLIGSQAYVENDHVGLKDLDDEEEEDEEADEDELEEAIVEAESDLETKTESEVESSTESENDELFVEAKKKDFLFDEESEIDDDTNIFSSTKKQNENLFDDDDDSDDSAGSGNFEQEPIKSNSKPPVLDFASELSRKIAMKGAKQTATEKQSSITETQEPILTKSEQKSNLFDDEDEKDDIFSSSKTMVISQSKIAVTNNLFSDDDEEDDKNKNLIHTNIEKNVQNKPSDKLDKILKVEKQDNSNKTTLFDSDNSDNEEDDFFSSKNNKLTKIEPIKGNTKITLFDDDDEDDDYLFSKTNVEEKQSIHEDKSEPVKKNFNPLTDALNMVVEVKNQKNVPANVLFEDNTKYENDTKKIDTHKQPVVPIIKYNKKTLFDDEDNDNNDDDLFSKAKTPLSENWKDNKKIQEELPAKTNDSSVKISLFDDDEDEDDLFTNSKADLIVKPIPAVQDLNVNENDDENSFYLDKNVKEKSLENSKSKSESSSQVKNFPIDQVPEDQSELIKPKKVIKNVLFDPSALKSSNLFKKIAKIETSDSEDDENNKQELKEENQNQDLVNTDPLFDFVYDETKPAKFVTNQDLMSPDLFDNIPQQIQLTNNVQKDRIKAASGKKRAPITQRKRTLILQDEDTYSVNTQAKIIEADYEKSNPDMISESSKVEVDLLKSQNFEVKNTHDSLNNIKIDDQRLESKKSSILFDFLSNDEEDIFKLDPKPKAEKKKEPENFSKTNNKTKTRKNLLFDDIDDDDIFGSKLKPKKQEKNESKSSVGKNSIFADFNDDDDIFSK